MKLTQLARPYLRSLEVRNRSADTVRRQRNDLARFFAHLAERGIVEVEALGKDAVLGFQEALAEALSGRGGTLRVMSQVTILISIRGFLQWLWRSDYVALDLSRGIVLPKREDPLPKEVIEADEMRAIKGVVDLTTPTGRRDRAMLEVLDSTGIRLNELIHLRVTDVDLEGRFVYVHKGKGGRDRVVPIGATACAWVQDYLLEVRPQLTADAAEEILFLNCHGRKLSKHAVDAMVRRVARRAGIRKRVTPHCFRVTCTTAQRQSLLPVDDN